MKIDRSLPSSSRSRELLHKLDDIHGPCLACRECNGLCAALIDTLMLPDIIVKTKRRSRDDRALQTTPDRP